MDVESLLARYVERRLAGRNPPEPAELCGDSPELLEPLRAGIARYEAVAREFSDSGVDSALLAAARRLGLPSTGGSAASAVTAPWPDSPALRLVPGEVLARRYRIRELLGRGGMGEVYLAEDTQLERRVALKVLPPELAADSERLRRLEREAKALAAVDHPSIVTVHSVEQADGVSFLTMAFVEGQTLAEMIGPGGLPVERLLELGVSLADALRAAHERGIVHRDLKPANVMVDTEGRLRILDFGLAKLLPEPGSSGAGQLTTETRWTRRGAIVGTHGYMSPEQAEGRAADARSDIYSFGVVLYELAAGTRPFREGIAADPPQRSIRGLRRDLPRDLRRIIGRCLANSPADRYPSAESLLRDLVASRRRYRRLLTRLLSVLRRPAVAVPGLIFLAVGLALAVWLWQRAEKRRWAREELLPEIERLVEASWRDYSEAYELALEAEKHIPDDPRLAELFSRSSFDVSVITEPPGARIHIKSYFSPDEEWRLLGVSPLDGVRLPITFLRWKVEKRGYETVLAAASTWARGPPGGPLLRPADLAWVLDPTGSVPPGMVRVRGADTGAGPLGDFFVDRYEVTNRDFQEFVDEGGYRARQHWKHDFIEDGRPLTWAAAMARFVDQTGRPGPATWQAGVYPEGQADYPVAGVSWYEAAAYADFRGKSLPTGFHWGLAQGEATTLLRSSFPGGYALLAPFSNFGGRGPREVGSLPGITPFGAYDMAGNVREWCSNETEGGHLVRGGSWSDPPYMFVNPSQLPSTDRSPANGFRCAYYPDPGLIPEAARGTFALPAERRDFFAEEPVSDEVFRVLEARFAYDSTDLEARIEASHESQYWSHETVSYDAAYGGERVTAHLFLPRNVQPPYQTVVYFPGTPVVYEESSVEIEEFFEFPVFLSFVVKNGRAVLFPVYKGSFERRIPGVARPQVPDMSYRYSEYVTQLVKDFSRSIDYLETRDDIDSGKIAYYGVSWGGSLGGIITAVEDRLRASILVSGGLNLTHPSRPETDAINYLPRVRLPTLMLNGRYDLQAPPELAVRPMHEFLGTPAEEKELLLFDTGHTPPRNEVIEATLSWLDRYLGPVG